MGCIWRTLLPDDMGELGVQRCRKLLSKSLGGHLASVHSLAENNFIHHFHTSGSTLLGATRTATGVIISILHFYIQGIEFLQNA
jgi:hypothetical protein